jgi:hypothetical protein
MEICFTINGIRHCFIIPVLEWPVNWKIPGDGPVNYPPLIQDAIILAAFKNAVEKIGDASVREVVQSGIKQGAAALQRLAGSHVAINMG